MRQQGISGVQGVRAGSCHAWPLPADATCASVARQVFRESVSEIGLEPEILDDCVLMASELAANTLHARAVAGTGGGGDRLVSVVSDGEGSRSRRLAPANRGASAQPGPVPRTAARLLRAVAVSARGRRPARAGVQDLRLLPRLAARLPARPAGTSAHAVAGRGLQLVQELSCGRWGHHPTRARAGRLGPARQGGLVLGAGPARARPAGRRDRAARLHAVRRRHRGPGL